MRYFCVLHDWDDDRERCATCRAEALAREEMLCRALAAAVSGDVSDIGELYTVLEPTGLRLRIRGVTVARFRGRRISSWRSHWEDLALAS